MGKLNLPDQYVRVNGKYSENYMYAAHVYFTGCVRHIVVRQTFARTTTNHQLVSGQEYIIVATTESSS
jgi:hypothetical protein